MMKSIDGIITARPHVLQKYDDIVFEAKTRKIADKMFGDAVVELKMRSHQNTVHIQEVGMHVGRLAESQSITDKKQNKVITLLLQALAAVGIGTLIALAGIL